MLRDFDDGLFAAKNHELEFNIPDYGLVKFPRAFSEHSDFYNMITTLVETAKDCERVPDYILNRFPNERNSIENFHKDLSKIIKEQGNSVWAWYIKNILGPDKLNRHKVNRMVGNPPWVTMSDIQHKSRKRRLEKAAGKGRNVGSKDSTDVKTILWMGGKLAPHFDIAKLFICHSRQLYMKENENNPAAWVTSAAIIKAGQWEKFRKWHEGEGLLSQTLDLSKIDVFDGQAVPCAVTFENRKSSLQTDNNEESVLLELILRDSEDKPKKNMSWKEVHKLIRCDVPRCIPTMMSDYRDNLWRQGATIVPKVLSIVPKSQSVHSKNHLTQVTTSNKRAKNPWKIEPRVGVIPSHWLQSLVSSRQLWPFGFDDEMDLAILPLDENGELLDEDKAREISKFWKSLDNTYQQRCGEGTSTPKTLMANLDFSSKLSKQLPLKNRNGHLVVYPASGSVMVSARLPADLYILDSKTYRFETEDIHEARYLVSLLNAPALQEAFKQSRASSRDFHKYPWKSVPIPEFNSDDEIHQELANLCEKAETHIEKIRNEIPCGPRKAPDFIRTKLKEEGILQAIDKQAARIFPDQVSHCTNDSILTA